MDLRSRCIDLVLFLMLACGVTNVCVASNVGGQSGKVTVSPASLQFTGVPVGGSASLNETVTNVGSRNITATSYTISGTGFNASGLAFPFTLPPGASFTFTVSFSPETGGNSTGKLMLFSATGSLSIPLSGSASAPGQLSVSPVNMNFGTVNIGSSSSQSATLTASGASVTVTAASVNNPEYAASGLTFPFTLQPGQSKSFTVVFTPQTSGSATASLDFSDSPNAPTVEALNGSGGSAPATVTLTWNASDSPVAGYNVFRGTSTKGPFAQLNSSPDPGTIYSDSTVTSGQTYYYVTTAVNSAGQQSVYSNQAEAVIP